jgi:hypothetical protein
MLYDFYLCIQKATDFMQDMFKLVETMRKHSDAIGDKDYSGIVLKSPQETDNEADLDQPIIAIENNFPCGLIMCGSGFGLFVVRELVKPFLLKQIYIMIYSTR